MKQKILASLLVAVMVSTSITMPVTATEIGEVEPYSETESEEVLSETEAATEVETPVETEAEKPEAEMPAGTEAETPTGTEAEKPTETEAETPAKTKAETKEEEQAETQSEKEKEAEEPQELPMRSARAIKQTIPLTVDASIPFTINTNGDTVAFTFTPTETAYYEIWTTGDNDTVVTLYETEGYVYLMDNDDDYSGSGVVTENNFFLGYRLEAGVSYTYEVGFYGAGIGNSTVHFSKLESKAIKTIELTGADTFVYPFEYEDSLVDRLMLEVTYTDGSTWSGNIWKNNDRAGNTYSYGVEEVGIGEYEVDIWVNDGRVNSKHHQETIALKSPADMPQTSLEFEKSETITLTNEWQYFSFTAAEAVNYLWQIDAEGVEYEVQVSNAELSSSLGYTVYGKLNFQERLATTERNYFRIRHWYYEETPTVTIKITKAKEIQQVMIEQAGEQTYISGIHYYNMALNNFTLKVVHGDSTSEYATFQGNGEWVTKEGYRLRAEIEDADGENYSAGNYIKTGTSTISIYGNSQLWATTSITARVVQDSDFPVIEEGKDVSINFGANYDYFAWFTPSKTGYYCDSLQGHWLEFSKLNSNGERDYDVNQLIAGQKYLVQIGKNDEDETSEKVRLVEDTRPQINETVLTGHEKTYDFIQPNTTLNLTFTPTKSFDYVIESHGESAPWVELWRQGAGDAMEYGYYGGEGDNFRLSYHLQAGVTYIYKIRMNRSYTTGSFSITLNGRAHAHTWGLMTIEKQATCGATGQGYQECSQCGERGALTIIPATGRHTYGAYVTTKQATCATAGQSYQECTQCKQKGASAVIPATGRHTYGAYVTTKAATAVSTGIRTRTCTIVGCGHKDTVTMPKLAGYAKFNFSGTLPLKVKQSTTAVKVAMETGDSVQAWKSSNKKIATVSKSGKITGKKAGTATITVTLKSGVTKSFKVKVTKAAVKTKSVKLNTKKVTLKKGEKVKLVTTLSPITTKEKVKFSTSNKKVATVTSKGVIQAKKKGTATITVRVGTKKVTCKVTVE